MLPKIQRELRLLSYVFFVYRLEVTDTDFYLQLVNFIISRHFFFTAFIDFFNF